MRKQIQPTFRHKVSGEIIPGWKNPGPTEQIDEIFEQDPPEVPEGHIAEKSEEPSLVDGHWMLTYVVRPLTEEELAERVQWQREGTWATRGQCLRALADFGLGPAILAWRNDPARTLADIAWFDEPNWRRLDDRIVSMGPDFGLTPGQIDELFVMARTL